MKRLKFEWQIWRSRSFFSSAKPLYRPAFFLLTGMAIGVLCCGFYLAWRQPTMLTRVPVAFGEQVGVKPDLPRVSKTLEIALASAPHALDALGPLFGQGETDRPPRALSLLKSNVAAYLADARKSPIRLAAVEDGSGSMVLMIRSAPIRNQSALGAVDEFLAQLAASYVAAPSDGGLGSDPAMVQELARVRFGTRKSRLDAALYKAAISAGVSSAELQFHAAGAGSRDPSTLAISILGAIIANKGNPEHWIGVWGPKISELQIAASELSNARMSIRDLPYARLPRMKVAGEPVFETEIARDLALAVFAALVGGGVGLLIGWVKRFSYLHPTKNVR